MLSLRTRAAFSFAIALVVAGCVEVEVRRTLAPDHSGRQTLTLRAPKTARTDAFPGLFGGATCQPPATQADGDRVTRTAEVTFADVAAFRHQAGFLSSVATVEPTGDGGVAYRETLTNSYRKNLERAPSDAARQSLTAEMDSAKKALADAKLTYTIQFPAPIAKSNADRVSGNEATWVLNADKVFAGRTLELTAEYRTAPPPVVAVAVPPAGMVPLAAPVAPEPPKAPAPPKPAAEPVAKPVAAPAPKPAAPVAAPAPKPVEVPVTRPSSRLEDVLLAQADEPAEEAPPKKAAPPKAVAPKKPPKKEEAPEPAELPAELLKRTPADLAEAATDDATTAEVKKLFREAIVQIDLRKYDKAAEDLQKAIALKPDSVLISTLYEQVVAKFLDAAIESDNAEMKAQAEALQRLAYKGRIRQLRDPKRVKELIDALRGKKFLPRTFAIEELTLAGDYAVPHLLKLMIDNTDPELRAYAGHIMSRMRGPAVPAICEALKHKDPMIRQILILALEVIADPRSVPSLLWLAQQPDGHPLVVGAARRALAQIEPDPAKQQTPAAIAFRDLAKDYYDGNRKVLPAQVYEHLVWRYDPETKELTSEVVPQHLYAPRMAEETCRNALLASPGYEPAVPLLLCAGFAQQNLIESFYTTLAGKEALSDEEKTEAEAAKPLRDRLSMAPAVGQAAGQKFLYAALQLALRDGRADVALSCINALRDVATEASLPAPAPPPEAIAKAAEKKKETSRRRRILIWYGPEEKEEPAPPPPVVNPNSIQLDGSPLIDALSYPDRRVRYAAAEAVVAIEPTHVIRDAPKVMANLAQALSETAYHVALLFEEDEGRAEEVRPLLREAGVLPVLVRTQTDALAAAREMPPKDVLILSGELKRVDVAEALANLRRVYTVAAAPAIVIAAKADEAKLRERLANEKIIYVPRPLTAGAIRAAIEEALKGVPEPKNKEASARYAASAARALASIHPAASIFSLDEALDALLEALSATTHPDSVRLPCCEAIRRAANPRAVPYLAQTYGDPKASKDLRLAILHALGACAGAQPNLPDDMAKRVVQVLTIAAAEPDPDFRRAAALAFGLKGGASGNLVDIIDLLHGKGMKPAPAAAPAVAPAAEPAAGDKPPATLPAEKAPEEKKEE